MAQDIDSSYRRYLPNFLSALRVALIPVVVWLTLGGAPLPAFIVFAVGALTDFLDGWLARRYNWLSYTGVLLDLVADKLFVLCLMALLWRYDAVLPLYAGLVLLRYSVQLSVLPVLLGWKKIPFKVAPRIAPKVATATAFLALGAGFLQQVAIDRLSEISELARLVDSSIGLFGVVGCLLETWILATFLPRYWLILRGRHDTFE